MSFHCVPDFCVTTPNTVAVGILAGASIISLNFKSLGRAIRPAHNMLHWLDRRVGLLASVGHFSMISHFGTKIHTLYPPGLIKAAPENGPAQSTKDARTSTPDSGDTLQL
jgi:hypothetical protein